MTKIRTILIDDEPIALEKLRSYASKIPYLEVTGSYSNPLEATEAVNSGEAEAIFTDIEMPDLDGLNWVRSLPSPTLAVFITAYPQYAIESYSVSAVDYLLKPYGFADFQRAAAKVLERYNMTHRAENPATDSRQRTADSIFIKTDFRYVRVRLDDILYIKGYGEYLQIYTASATAPLVTLSSFAAIRKSLPENFMQTHRSYIVNMDRAERIERARIVMPGEEYLPVGDSYRKALADYLASHSAGR